MSISAAAPWHTMAISMITSLPKTTTAEGHSVTDGELTHGIATAAEQGLQFTQHTNGATA